MMLATEMALLLRGSGAAMATALNCTSAQAFLHSTALMAALSRVSGSAVEMIYFELLLRVL
jgi:hypothetical protein